MFARSVVRFAFFIFLFAASSLGMAQERMEVSVKESDDPKKVVASVDSKKEVPSHKDKRVGKEDIRIYPDSTKTRFQIRYEIPEKTSVVLKVYNLKGRSVRTLYKGSKASGQHAIIFNTTSPGIYMLEANIGNTTLHKHLVRSSE